MTSSVDSEATEASQRKGYTPPKDRPTPKRKEAARDLRGPVSAPQTRKEAYKQYRDRQRRQLQREREGYIKGDERFFQPKDRGPVRAFARDYVDSRRSVSEFFLYFSLAIIVLLFLPFPEFQLTVTYVVWPLMMMTIVVEGLFTGRRVKRAAAARFPDESLRGVGMYAAMRQLQIRKLRLPKPRVKPGEAI
ncbi:DUF3043 domain-containing protein [Marinactinospora thermotolerans]|uniref:DUF3043 domain-containing protein n=1 Tax=Marinactinospora thermotolerans DSM 45154 TaxID=1122192 RepID=A0A1T4MCT9_9ACTN|nr:DUF3043 domain-containing protein [Marinactinospora thermotolerans]SJZ64677.1 Protein of unknown function [Marinactinospora thermotolerans DSM 45154]